jgi:hypothetical protein
MNGKWLLAIALVLVVIVGAVTLGAYAYNIGLAQGVAQADKLPAPATGVMPYRFAGGPFFFRPWGFGFGFLGCLFPLFFFFLFFGLLRMMFWGRRWGWRGHHGMSEHGVPHMFEEWHQKMHEPK